LTWMARSWDSVERRISMLPVPRAGRNRTPEPGGKAAVRPSRAPWPRQGQGGRRGRRRRLWLSSLPRVPRCRGSPVRPTIVTHDAALGASLAELETERRPGRGRPPLGQPGDDRPLSAHLPPGAHSGSSGMEERAGSCWPRTTSAFGLRARSAPSCAMRPAPTSSPCPIRTGPLTFARCWRCPGTSCPRLAGRARLPAMSPRRQQGRPALKREPRWSMAAAIPIVPWLAGGGRLRRSWLLLGSNSTLRASFDGLVKPLQKMVWIQQHVAPGRFTVSASSMAGSSVLSWFRGICVEDEPEGASDLWRTGIVGCQRPGRL
jgi:hypothetical protein